MQEHEARLIQSILEGVLRDLRPNRAAVALARRWGGEEEASAYAWDRLENLQFTGRVYALIADEVIAHNNHPMIAIYDTDVVIDLVKGLSIALMFLAENQIELWRRQARSGREAVYLPSAEDPIAIEVEALVAAAFGFGEAVVAGARFTQPTCGTDLRHTGVPSPRTSALTRSRASETLHGHASFRERRRCRRRVAECSQGFDA